jgi:hypothetical protein
MSIKDIYKVQPIKPFECKDWLLGKHYAKRIPSISWAFGLYKLGALEGVCTFGTPASSTLLRGVCGDDYAQYVLELNRLVINEPQPQNVASFFVGAALRLLPKPSIVVSYADTAQNHCGYVYQACNFAYTGLSSKFLDPVVEGLEHQHHATYAHGMTNEQLRAKFGDKLSFVERSRKHRYVAFCGSRTFKNSAVRALRYEIQPYPKGDNQRYDASYQPVTQGILF